MAVRIHVRLLHDVFGFAFVAKNRASRSVDPLIVPAHQHLEEGSLTCEHTGHDLLIREQGPSLEHWRADDMHRLPIRVRTQAKVTPTAAGRSAEPACRARTHRDPALFQ